MEPNTININPTDTTPDARPGATPVIPTDSPPTESLNTMPSGSAVPVDTVSIPEQESPDVTSASPAGVAPLAAPAEMSIDTASTSTVDPVNAQTVTQPAPEPATQPVPPPQLQSAPQPETQTVGYPEVEPVKEVAAVPDSLSGTPVATMLIPASSGGPIVPPPPDPQPTNFTPPDEVTTSSQPGKFDAKKLAVGLGAVLVLGVVGLVGSGVLDQSQPEFQDVSGDLAPVTADARDAEIRRVTSADYYWVYIVDGDVRVMNFYTDREDVSENTQSRSYTLDIAGSKLTVTQIAQSLDPESGFSSEASTPITQELARVESVTETGTEIAYYQTKPVCIEQSSPCFYNHFLGNDTEGYFSAKLSLNNNLSLDARANILTTFDEVVAQITTVDF